MGGQLAQLVALSCPGRVASLTLIATSAASGCRPVADQCPAEDSPRHRCGAELRSTNPDVHYFCEQIADHLDGTRVRWAGTVHGTELTRLVATARATLTPITWDEPGGTAVVESLALGTPVIGFRRGCLPELVSHGRTGLLATPDDEADLAEQLLKSPYLDPAVCAQEAVERFRPAVMAENYLRLYREILNHDG